MRVQLAPAGPDASLVEQQTRRSQKPVRGDARTRATRVRGTTCLGSSSGQSSRLLIGSVQDRGLPGAPASRRSSSGRSNRLLPGRLEDRGLPAGPLTGLAEQQMRRPYTTDEAGATPAAGTTGPRSPTGRGGGLRNRLVGVRLAPRIPPAPVAQSGRGSSLKRCSTRRSTSLVNSIGR